MGWRTGLAPRASSSRTSDSVWPEARVMRILRPTSGDAEASAMLGANCFENSLSSRFEEQARNVFAERGGLLRRRGGALTDILRAVDGTDAGFEDKFAMFGTGPGADGNLAAALQGCEQRTFRDDSGAGFRIVESAENIRCFVIRKAALRGDGTLTYGGKKNVG